MKYCWWLKKTTKVGQRYPNNLLWQVFVTKLWFLDVRLVILGQRFGGETHGSNHRDDRNLHRGKKFLVTWSRLFAYFFFLGWLELRRLKFPQKSNELTPKKWPVIFSGVTTEIPSLSHDIRIPRPNNWRMNQRHHVFVFSIVKAQK